MIRRASSGTNGLVGKSPPTRAAGSAGCVGDVTDLDAWVFPAAETVPLAPAAVPPLPDARASEVAADPAAPDVPVAPVCPLPVPAAAAPAALPMGGNGGGDESAPRVPLKVGLLQFEALSC